jgi:hypothetical protein
MSLSSRWQALRRVSEWRRAARALRSGRAERAVERLTALGAGGPAPHEEKALLATALLMSGKFAKAQSSFASLRKELRDAKDAEGIYLHKYCLYYLALIRDDRSQAAYEARVAAAVQCRRSLKRLLPAPPIPEKAKPGVAATATADG